MIPGVVTDVSSVNDPFLSRLMLLIELLRVYEFASITQSCEFDEANTSTSG